MERFCKKKLNVSSTQGALCTVSVFFLFYILLIWGCLLTQRTPLPTGPAVHTRVAHAFLNRPLHDVDFQFPASYDHALIIHVSR